MTRPGFTLVELLITVLLLGVVIPTALGVLDAQKRAFGHGAEQAELMKNLMHATSTLRRDLRTAGTNLAPGQPFVVFASPDLVAVNADYATNVANDPFAVYHDPDAPTGSVGALTSDRSFVLPGTAFSYPDTTYRVAGGPVGAAETLIFFFATDPTTSAPDDHVLFRQVNTDAPEVVARNITRVDGEPFFEYLSVGGASVDGGRTSYIALGRLPVAHTVPVHGSAADTTPFALVDSIRGVRVRLMASNGRTGRAASARGIETMIRLPNAGLRVERSCGSAPIFGEAVNVEARVVDQLPEVELTWQAAVDEARGERDVIRYVIWKEGPGAGGGDEPFVSIPAGSSTYAFVDRDVVSEEAYTYRIAAQDCTPSLSPSVTAVANVP